MERNIQRVVFWQNILSIHQSAFARALAAQPRLEVWFACEEDLPQMRKEMGWTAPDYGTARVADVRDPEQWSKLAKMEDPQTCHAFGSYFLLPRAHAAFKTLRQAPCCRVWTSEAFDHHGWRGWIRLQRARWHVWTEARSGFDCVMPMGELGVRFFRRAGFEQERLREFGYAVEPPCHRNNDSHISSHREFRFLFVGQLIRRKGVDLLLRAAAMLPGKGWSLELIGSGAEQENLAGQARKLGLSKRVIFSGPRDHAQTLEAIQSSDALILPSRWDGWGAVVNESLMHGTPVIVSESCGAASLVANEACGRVVPRGDARALSLALRFQIGEKDSLQQRRKKIRKWAAVACGAEPLARYFLACVNSPESTAARQPPWRAAQSF